METVWEVDLPTYEDSEDYHYESKIWVKEGKVYYLYRRLRDLKLIVIDAKSGSVESMVLPSMHYVIPSEFFLFAYKDIIIFYTGEFWMYDGKSAMKVMQLAGISKIEAYYINENRLILSDGFSLYCFDLDTFENQWIIDTMNSKPYRVDEIIMFEQTIACYGRDSLLFIDPLSGEIQNQIKIPRIDKLFHPIRTGDGNLLIGYTNWSNAGVIKYDVHTGKVIWRHKRKFEGPQLNCKLYTYENYVYWVKNDTELICLNIDTGDEVFTRRTTPWIYTDLRFDDDKIMYGTAGANGYFNCINARSGLEYCSVYLQNGCAFYETYQDTVLVGDFSKQMMQLSPQDGRILQTLPVDGEVVGDIRVCDSSVYTVIFANENKPVRLIKIEIE